VCTCACWAIRIEGRQIGDRQVPRQCDCPAASAASTGRRMEPLGRTRHRDRLRRRCECCSFEAPAGRVKNCDGIGPGRNCDRHLGESAA
jgi:hypothetical protein